MFRVEEKGSVNQNENRRREKERTVQAVIQLVEQEVHEFRYFFCNMIPSLSGSKLDLLVKNLCIFMVAPFMASELVLVEVCVSP